MERSRYQIINYSIFQTPEAARPGALGGDLAPAGRGVFGLVGLDVALGLAGDDPGAGAGKDAAAATAAAATSASAIRSGRRAQGIHRQTG